MAGAYNLAVQEVLNRSLDLTSTLKLMLVTGAYSYSLSDTYVKVGGFDAASAEINVTGYVPGWGQSGRQTASLAFVEQNFNNRVIITIGGVTWTALAAGTTIAGAILIKEGIADDTTSLLIAYFDVTPTATNGHDVALSFDGTNGNIWFTL